jgi:nucleotide-binding universal stress UspA family protein
MSEGHTWRRVLAAVPTLATGLANRSASAGGSDHRSGAGKLVGDRADGVEIYPCSVLTSRMAVLVAYDGSDPAQKAVERAITAAEELNEEEIVLLRVVEAADGMLEAGVDIIQDRLKELRDENPDELSADIKRILEQGAPEFRIETVVGKPAREIVSYAEENDIAEIVIGSHGREGISRVLLGSVAEKVVRRAPTTVIVVR